MGTYAKAFEIPTGFPQILREFALEAIRQQPEDIHKFGYEYFEGLSTKKSRVDALFVESLAPAEASVAPSEGLGVIKLGVHEVAAEGPTEASGAPDPKLKDALSDRISMVFQEADVDGNGTLERKEFQEVFELIGSEIGLTSLDVLEIMAEADNNDDGVIEYREFLPVAMETIEAIMAKEQFASEREMRRKRLSAQNEVADYLMKGLPRHELEASIQQIFRAADGDDSGALDRDEFVRCLEESGMGFTRRERNLILTLIDKNGDGIIDYQEFMPVCFSMIVQLLSDKMQEIPEEESDLSHTVHALLLKASNGRETLTAPTASECLKQAGLGLRFVQVLAIMSEVEEDENGLVKVQEVASTVAGILCALKQLHTSQHTIDGGKQSATVFKAARKTEDLAKVAGLEMEQFTEKLSSALKSKDEAGTGSLETREVCREAITAAFPELVPQQVHALSSLLEPLEDGRWGYERVVTWGFRTLQELVGQNLLLHSVSSTVKGSE